MLCRNPYVKAGAAYPCGRCEPCLYNKKRLWTNRIMLEKLCHSSSVFVTLTYDDEHLPKDDGIMILVRDHLQLWLKRFRERIAPTRIRFYAVGEYGNKSDRPHFHIIVFNYPMCVRGRTLQDEITGQSRWRDCCDVCRVFGDSWGYGDVYLGDVETASAAYVAKYTLKHMTRYDDIRLNGRPPEFCRMSLRPGIGADAMWDVASAMMQYNLDERLIDVPTELAVGKSKMPLGRYLRNKLRVAIGRKEGAPLEALEAMAEEMRPLREAAFNSSSSFAAEIVKAGNQRVRNIEAVKNVYKGKDKL